MTTSVKPRNKSNVLNVSEEEVSKIMADLHEEVEPARKPGEFTTSEYAKKNDINMGKAHKELTRLHEQNRIEKRKGSKDCYWRKVES